MKFFQLFELNNFLEKNFFLHWIHLNNFQNLDDFFGFFDCNNDKWEKGILEQLLEGIKEKKRNSFFHTPFINFKKENYEMKELIDMVGSNSFLSFNSIIANKIDEKLAHNNLFCESDWIIYDLTENLKSSKQQNIILEQVMKRKIILNNQRVMNIGNNIIQLIEVII